MARIALMLPRLSRYGGVEQFSWHLAESLVQAGHEVDFLCAKVDGQTPAGVRPCPVGRVGGFKVLKMLFFMFRVEQLRKKGNYDLSVSLGKTWNQDLLRVGGGPLRIFWKLSSKAYPVGWERNSKSLRRILSPSNWLNLYIEQQQFKHSSQIIAVSHLVKDWIEQAYPDTKQETNSRAAPISIIYNRPSDKKYAPPTKEERRQARKAWNISAEQYCLTVAGTNFRLKGIISLIHALPQLPKHMTLLIAGGRQSARYIRMAHELAVADRVHFLGKVDDMRSLYHATDMFVLPTFYDACSNAVLEALACGCKTLTSQCNGAAYFLPPKQRLANPDNVQELVHAINRLEQAPKAAPFVWPEEIPTGVPGVIAKIEQMLAEKKHTTFHP